MLTKRSNSILEAFVRSSITAWKVTSAGTPSTDAETRVSNEPPKSKLVNLLRPDSPKTSKGVSVFVALRLNTIVGETLTSMPPAEASKVSSTRTVRELDNSFSSDVTVRDDKDRSTCAQKSMLASNAKRSLPISAMSSMKSAFQGYPLVQEYD